MLFAGCSNCQSIVPLWCAGQFMPHMPMPAEASPMGPYCGFCGPVPPIFTCMTCGARQWLFMPGARVPPPQVMGAGPPSIAPVVQASEHTNEHDLKSMCGKILSDFLGEAAKSAGRQFGQDAGSGLSNWAPQ